MILRRVIAKERALLFLCKRMDDDYKLVPRQAIEFSIDAFLCCCLGGKLISEEPMLVANEKLKANCRNDRRKKKLQELNLIGG
jgi:hypothetical protein